MPHPIDSSRRDRDWRLLAEFTLPSGPPDDQWATAGLAPALDALRLPRRDLDRFTGATEEAVMRALRHATAPGAVCPQLTVRVFISSLLTVGIPFFGWGFFIVERSACEADGVPFDGEHSQPGAVCIELCIYADQKLE